MVTLLQVSPNVHSCLAVSTKIPRKRNTKTRRKPNTKMAAQRNTKTNTKIKTRRRERKRR